MKTQKRYLIILLTFLAVLMGRMGMAVAQNVEAQDVDDEYAIDYTYDEKGKGGVTFSLKNGSIVFRGGKWYGPNKAGKIVSGDHSSDNNYIVVYDLNDPSDTTHWVNNFIIIYTANSLSGVTTTSPYNIELQNIKIDRSGVTNPGGTSGHGGPSPTTLSGYQERCGPLTYNSSGNGSYTGTYKSAPLNLGDNTVQVNLTVTGNNVIKGEPGGNAVIQYLDLSGISNATGSNNLTIDGTGKLTLKKDGTMNAGACLGAPMWSSGEAVAKNGAIVIGGSVTIDASTGGEYDCAGGAVPVNTEYGSYAAAIGGGASTRSGNITFKDNCKVTATAYATAAAIGGGGGRTMEGRAAAGTITIQDNATVTARNGGNSLVIEPGVCIGGGSSNEDIGGILSELVISGGTVTAEKWDRTANDWVPGHIGGGNSNTQGLGSPGLAGDANDITISGGVVTAGSIGGGSANIAGAGANGGNATVTLKVPQIAGVDYPVDVTGTIGGGSSISGNGGSATINVQPPTSGTAGVVRAASIGGGNSGTGNGGTATVNVTGGNLLVTGKIGGGKSFGSGAGGNALINITGGTLDCASIGGGDSQSGTPGMVYQDASTAGVRISDGSLTAGFIGGGTRLSDGAAGKASANISGGTIQGQFILVLNDGSSSLSNHCYFTMTGGTIDNAGLGAIGVASHPRLKENGGAVYIDDPYGVVTIEGNSTIQNCTGSVKGGAIYANNGNITVQANGLNSPQFLSNSATYGGALYMDGGSCTITSGSIGTSAGPNTASTSGGGIYANGGTIDFSNGTIGYNSAGVSGGGIYVSEDGQLTMTGSSTITRNHVPANHHGGGVYLEGVVTLGSSSKTTSTILAQDNYAGASYQYGGGSNNRNNIYLPDPRVNSNHTDVITVVNGSLSTDTRVGFSVPSNFVPVIFCDETAPYTYLQSFTSGGSMENAVFDDAEKYATVHYSSNSFYDPQHIYLSGGTWVDIVDGLAEAPAGFSVSGSNVTISSSEGLAWLIKYINGIGTVTTTPQTGVNVVLDDDLDMGDYAWVPMGSNAYSGTGTTFTGSFNGNGHTISNLNCQYLGTQTGDILGLFGTLGSSATVENVQLINARINTSDKDSGTAQIGSIAGQMAGGTIEHCITNATVSTLHSGTVLGGLVGQVTGGTIRNCMAITSLSGYQMGSLVGSNAGDIYNSFASASFDYKGSSEYFGGLVGVNTGRVENCYIRVRGTAPSSTYFGYLAGNNTAATDKGLYYCYSPSSQYVATKVGTTAGTQTGLGTFTVTTATAYNYKAHDNQVTASDNSYVPTTANKQLVKTLNKWVKEKGSTYAKWLRPTTQVINGDYPLLRMPASNAVAASSGAVTLDYGDINDHITDYNLATEAICFYGTKSGMNSNSSSSAPLYIDQDALLTPASGSKDGDIVGYVGVTLDNSAVETGHGANPSWGGITDNIDWHFFSSVLSDAPIGLDYTPAQATFTDENGYFPTNLGSYYSEWDLYGYYEPDYHWVNYKREEHWHEDYPDIPINYTNHTNFQPGYGYMVALAEESYLQAHGTLNTHPDPTQALEVSLDYTPDISWTTRQGHNLLGNPYQSYLDFDLFATYNSGLWSGGETNAYYIIMDEDQDGYIYYGYNASVNEFTAPKYLHPHQGFMVIVGREDMTAKFDDRMRNTTAEGVTFRDGQPRFPLVNLFATDDNGNRDMVTVELGRPDKGGAPKQHALCASMGSLWCSYEGEDYAIAFTKPGLDYASIRFASHVDSEYTMTWNTQNGEFSYLHLIDNMTGADIDCLSTSEYKFSARESDYNSRFRLVFDYTGIDDHEVPEPVEGPATFAYYANGEIHLTDADDDASLQIIDMTGRVIVCRDAARHVSTNGMAPGVYVLRLTTANGTRTQKIILN